METDETVIEKFKAEKPWGMSTTIDLYQCNADSIRSAEKIQEFVIELCKLLEVKRFGDTVIVDFGEEPRVSGYSMTQLIETSLVSGHFVNQTNAVYLDIFSCKEYPAQKAAMFCKAFFEAKEMKSSVTFRY